MVITLTSHTFFPPQVAFAMDWTGLLQCKHGTSGKEEEADLSFGSVHCHLDSTVVVSCLLSLCLCIFFPVAVAIFRFRHMCVRMWERSMRGGVRNRWDIRSTEISKMPPSYSMLIFRGMPGKIKEPSSSGVTGLLYKTT